MQSKGKYCKYIEISFTAVPKTAFLNLEYLEFLLYTP